MTDAEQAKRWEERDVKLAAAHAMLAEGIAELTRSEEWMAMLAAAARFHQYSWRNCLMILQQFPGATQVAGYRSWQAMGRQVRKGEPGIRIWAHFDYRTGDDDSESPAAGEEPDRQRRDGWKIEHVWDITQTGGDPLPESVKPALLEGEAPDGMWEALAGQVTALGYCLVREADPRIPAANGSVTPSERTVRVRADLTPSQAVKTLAHELGHIRCGHIEASCTDPRSRAEVEAESVAFLVCHAMGFDSSAYTLPYIAGWADAGKEIETVSLTAQLVVTTARLILDDMLRDI
jgi:hypothetical protein